MPRQIAPKLVKAYIKADAKLDATKAEVADLKETLRHLNDRGYESPLLRFQPSTVWSPDWRKLVNELTSKYMKPAERRVYFSRLKKRFPRKPREASIIILSKKRKSKEDRESMAA